MAAGEEKSEGACGEKAGMAALAKKIRLMAKWRNGGSKRSRGGICSESISESLAAHGEKLACVMRRWLCNIPIESWQPKMAYRRVMAAALARQSAASKKENWQLSRKYRRKQR
jgi:hypothetical protein